MKRFLVFLGLISCCIAGFAQELQDTTLSTRADTSRNPIAVRDTLGQDTVMIQQGQDSVPVAVKETRAERRAREKAEKEHDKYYFKGIRKDSARLAIERVGNIAWKRSLIVPGWGQYTNGGLWWIKVPVIYGGFVTSYLVFDYWQFYFSEYQSELQYRFNHNGEPSDGPLGAVAVGNEQFLQRNRDFARRNRDITILATIGWYALGAVEAYVDSMLKNRWNISDDLSFKLSPTTIPTYAGNMAFASGMGGRSLFTPGVKLTIGLR